MYEAYRVKKEFQWRGWTFAPKEESSHVPKEIYGGDIWIVEAGHDRKPAMLSSRFGVSDLAVPNPTELLKDPKYSRLLEPPKLVKKK